MKRCVNHYLGGSCDNFANPSNKVLDVCGRPLVYCDRCYK